MTDETNLTNKLYLITGASSDSDIGLAICKKLDSMGAKLILTGRRSTPLLATLEQLSGTGHQVETFDLTQLEDISNWIKSLSQNYGCFDGLVHSASFQGYTPLRTLKAKQIRQYFDINFSAALLLTAALAKPKNHNKDASFVFIGSAAGLKGLKARSLYAASKAALSSMTKSVALELAEKSIRVNCVAPALVSGSKAEQQFSMLSEAQIKQLLEAHPLGLSSPLDVANSVYFLLSDLSANTTGTILAVDGGYLAG